MAEKKKPSKLPQVKMTLTTKLRLLKANPLLKYACQNGNSDTFKKLNLDNAQKIADQSVSLLKNSIFKDDNESVPTEKIEKPLATNTRETVKTKDNRTQIKRQIRTTTSFRHTNTTKTSELKRTFSNKYISKPSNVDKKPVGSQKRINSKTRRSLSAQDLSILHDENNARSLSQSNERLNKINTSISQLENDFFSQNGTSIRNSSNIHFPTPKGPEDLRKRLNEWISKRKSINCYRHLKCFGVDKIDVVKEENKENVEVTILNNSSSYEELSKENEEDIKELSISESDLLRISKDALSDLRKLISDGYPIKYCEAWLNLVKEKVAEIEHEPIYWECRADIEQNRGNLGSAVECYQKAIVNGADTSLVDKSLDQLLEKFNLLNINSNNGNSKSFDHKKIVLDARNVFKSSVIQFALKEKTNKNSKEDSGSKFLITPVRRSTRNNRNRYTLTPGTKLYSDLREIDEDTRGNMEFHYNAALK